MSTIIDKGRIQVIRGDAGPTHAVVPWDIWTAIEATLEAPAGRSEAELSDEDLFDAADTSGEAFPQEVVEQLARGVHPVKVFRKCRGLTQAELAERIGTSAAYLSQIENGRSFGRNTLDLLARALKVDMDDLMPKAGITDDKRPIVRMVMDPKFVPNLLVVEFTGTWGSKGVASFRLAPDALELLEPDWRIIHWGEETASAIRRHWDRIARACARIVSEGRIPHDLITTVRATDFE